MAPYRRNILVGVTVLGAAIFMIFCLLEFGAKAVSVFAPPHVTVEIVAPQATGLTIGSDITYLGTEAGQVTAIQRSDSALGVVMTADLYLHVPINVNANIVTNGVLGGQSNVELLLKTNPITHEPQKPEFPQPGVPIPPIQATYVGFNLLPEEYTNAVAELGKAAAEIADTGAQLRQTGIYDHLNETVLDINQQVKAIGKVVDSVQHIVGDPQIQRDLKESIANLRLSVMNLKQFSAGLPQTQAQIAQLMGTLDSIAAKIDRGQGTAGMLVNDPQLYQAFVALSRDADSLIKDFQRIVEQWEQEGIHLKL